ncbi:MAG: hypothetical protein LBV31_04050 [Prevotellaceae bacterium]|jgi:hypothetical protein|nr:hypothetical protein [Prevotellaceae bacterium]
MKKFSLIVIVTMLMMVSAQAQKVTQGSLKFLKGETALNFAFDYSNLIVNGKSEQAYIDAEVAVRNQKEAGSGDTWKEEWATSYREVDFQTKVVEYFNQTMEGKIEGGVKIQANYQALVKTTHIVTGYMAGPMSKPAAVNVEVIFTKIGSDEVLAKVVVKNARTNAYNMGALAALNSRIAGAYSYVGQNIAVAVLKATK